MSLNLLFFNTIEDYRKALLYYSRANGSYWLFCLLSQLLAAGNLTKMWKNVTLKFYFDTPYGFERSRLFYLVSF